MPDDGIENSKYEKVIRGGEPLRLRTQQNGP